MRTSLHQVYTPTPHHHSLNTTVTYLSLRNCYPNYNIPSIFRNRIERNAYVIAVAQPPHQPRHQPGASASAAAPNADSASSGSSSRSITGSAATPNADLASSGSSSRITGKKRKAPCRRGGDEAVEQLVDLTEIRKRRKVTTDRRYNKKYAENNIRYAKQVVQWLVVVAKTSNL